MKVFYYLNDIFNIDFLKNGGLIINKIFFKFLVFFKSWQFVQFKMVKVKRKGEVIGDIIFLFEFKIMWLLFLNVFLNMVLY